MRFDFLHRYISPSLATSLVHKVIHRLWIINHDLTASSFQLQLVGSGFFSSIFPLQTALSYGSANTSQNATLHNYSQASFRSLCEDHSLSRLFHRL
ncbi:hypothetical protein PNI0427_01746 [Streptococcus pneumoniae PNI0427]|nr:hypothetical protein PNI0427_01746 [Streptococcus pneumoniae PNI0427]